MESGLKQETTLTSLTAVSFVVNAPARWTVAFNVYLTWPKSHKIEGEELEGMAKEMGYVYVPRRNNEWGVMPCPETGYLF